MNKTKDEEPLVTDNSVINVLSYFKLFECSKKYWTILMERMNNNAWQLFRENRIQQTLGMDKCAC